MHSVSITAPPHVPVASPSVPSRFPTIRPEHTHMRALVENAMRYVAPEHGLTDGASGYPVEGWNHDPSQGLFLRSFTQLTAIGLWMELLANVVAGNADTPHLSREQSLAHLARVARSLRQDQQDPEVSAKGLLGNFLDLAPNKRRGPLLSEVNKQRFVSVFGLEGGEAVWQALKAKGWLQPHRNDREAAIVRTASYGLCCFDGPLSAFADDATRQKIMAILDSRVVMAVFGDNANLTTSAAKTIGALLLPAIKDDPRVADVRSQLEQFLENQQEGYSHLYDARIGLFNFGWDACRDRFVGWEDEQGRWQPGYMDYLVNEFRGPAMFVVLRFGIPDDAIRNLGFQMKPYRMQDGRLVYALAPWEGSAFQALGLELSMLELTSPSWRRLLRNVVDIELDYAYRRQLPGFLSECYTGEGTQYTGDVGIPDITVNPKPRITHSASLYTLGVAYGIAPAEIEQFLAVNWPVISRLQSDHGPWEGFNVAKHEPIQIQTSAHTLSLILGSLGTGSDHMKRYLDSKGLGQRLAESYPIGEKTDLLSADTRVFAWADQPTAIKSVRDAGAFHVRGDEVQRVGIAFVPNRSEGVNLSGGALTLRYRSAAAMAPVVIGLKTSSSPEPRWIPKELMVNLAATTGQDAEIQVPLPATLGLTKIAEVVVTWQEKNPAPIDLSITALTCMP